MKKILVIGSASRNTVLSVINLIDARFKNKKIDLFTTDRMFKDNRIRKIFSPYGSRIKSSDVLVERGYDLVVVCHEFLDTLYFFDVYLFLKNNGCKEFVAIDKHLKKRKKTTRNIRSFWGPILKTLSFYRRLGY